MRMILVTGAPVPEDALRALRDCGFEVLYVSHHLSEAELTDRLKDVDVYLLGGSELVTPATIRGAARLSHIAFLGVGFSSFIDARAVTEAGIAITNTPGTSTSSVVELTVGHIINLTRKLSVHNTCAKAGTATVGYCRSLAGSVVGIIGMGNIGLSLATVLRNAFGMNVVYHSRTDKGAAVQGIEAVRLPLVELLSVSDVVVPLVPTTEETVGMIGSFELSLMKRTAMLVNVARASLVDAHALYEALRNEVIASAAFDGYYIEPLPSPADDPFGLLSLPDEQFIITPHVGAATPVAQHLMYTKAIQSISCFLRSGQDQHIVNPGYVRFARDLDRPWSRRTHSPPEGAG